MWFHLSGCDSQCRTCDSSGVCTSCRDPTKVLMFGECQYDSCAHQYYLNSTTRTCRGTPPLRRAGTTGPAPFMISINDSARSEAEFTAPSVIINWVQMCKQQICKQQLMDEAHKKHVWFFGFKASVCAADPLAETPKQIPMSLLVEVFSNNLVSSESSVFVQEAQ